LTLEKRLFHQKSVRVKEQKLLILIYGSSLFCYAIEATLAIQKHIQVMRADPGQVITPNEMGMVTLILVEAASWAVRQLTVMPQLAVPILVIDAQTRQITSLRQQQHNFYHMNDLVNLITQFTDPLSPDETPITEYQSSQTQR
jgi:hypothetical protein